MLPTRTALMAALALALCAIAPADAVTMTVQPDEFSLAQRIASDPDRLAEFERSLTPEKARLLKFEWTFWARPKQLAPAGDWDTWLVLAGRGWGKTRVAAEHVRDMVEAGKWKRVALAGATAADVRDTMVEGESGLLAVSPPWFRPKYEPSKRRLTWPNGAIATTFSADEPDRFRGPQHDGAWGDELAAWRYPDAWDQLQLGLRLGDRPQAVVTTTPRPIPLLKEILKDERTITTKGSTYENEGNLAAAFKRKVLAKYEGTRLGRQELHAELLDDTPGALWTRALLDQHRVRVAPQLTRVVVALDPSVADDGGGDECGIVVAGTGWCSCRGTRELHGFVVDDLSDHLSPNEWAQRAVDAYKQREADLVVAETNNGGALVELAIRTVDTRVAYRGVHAARGKRVRAEPVAALYEQGRVHHVGSLPKLDDELTTWSATTGEASPNRLDALVWAMTDLMLEQSAEPSAPPRIDTGFGLSSNPWSV